MRKTVRLYVIIYFLFRMENNYSLFILRILRNKKNGNVKTYHMIEELYQILTFTVCLRKSLMELLLIHMYLDKS